MDVYTNMDTVPLSFSQNRNSVLTTGLTVTVTVTNAQTGVSLLSSTSVPEVNAPSGIYTYMWVHGLTVDTECIVTYTQGTQKYIEYILVKFESGSRAV